MRNYLLPTIENYFSEIIGIESRLSITKYFLEARTKQLLGEISDSDPVFTAITSYRDLTIPKGQDNLFSPKDSFTVTANNLIKVTSEIESQHCCLAISQTYEVFESFLIELITEYIFRKQDELARFKIPLTNKVLLKEEVRKLVKHNQGKNNKQLLLFVRQVSPYFRQYESGNSFEINMSHWFDMISLIRHILVHNRQKINDSLPDYINKFNAQAIFDLHFKTKIIDHDVCIFMDWSRCNEVIFMFGNFAYFIFKSLSVDENLSPKIPQYTGST